jgi:hypothetical protein
VALGCRLDVTALCQIRHRRQISVDVGLYPRAAPLPGQCVKVIYAAVEDWVCTECGLK